MVWVSKAQLRKRLELEELANERYRGWFRKNGKRLRSLEEALVWSLDRLRLSGEYTSGDSRPGSEDSREVLLERLLEDIATVRAADKVVEASARLAGKGDERNA